MRGTAVVVRVRALPAPRGTETDAERQLVALAQSGDDEAKNVLLERYEPLVQRWANHYKSRGTVSEGDLIQEGRLGLLVAIGKYDPAYKASFFTYCYYKVHGFINLLISQYSRPVPIPRDQLPKLRDLIELEEQWDREGRDWNRADMAKELRLSVDAVDALQAVRHQVYIEVDATFENHGGYRTPADDVESVALDNIDRLANRVTVEEALKDLPQQQQFVIRHYYGFSLHKPRTLAQIGQLMGVGEARVSQIHRAALKNLAPVLAHVVGSHGARTTG